MKNKKPWKVLTLSACIEPTGKVQEHSSAVVRKEEKSCKSKEKKLEDY